MHVATDTLAHVAVPPPIETPVWIDIASVAIGATYGIARAFGRGLDIVGVVTLALVCGMGGGVVRDLLLDVRPVALGTNWYVATALLTVAALVVVRPGLGRGRTLLDATDAVMLAVFAVTGTTKALRLGVAPLPAMLVGVAAGVAGGVIADVLSGQTPELFEDGPLYAIAAAAGTGAFVLAHLVDAPFSVGFPLALATVFLLRLSALAWDLRVPMPTGLAPWLRTRMAARERRAGTRGRRRSDTRRATRA